MFIQDIYQIYQIPPNLIRHQLEVAAVGNFICDHWVGTAIDRDQITRALLLHDMGNIIKFKRPFLGELESNAVYWEQIQDQFVEKYGKDVDHATQCITDELGLHETTALIAAIHDVWSDPAKPVSWEARIGEYADCCVTPLGITTFDERIADLKQRYHYDDMSAPMQAAQANRRLVEKYVSVDLNQIDAVNFSEDIEKLRLFAFPEIEARHE